MSNDNGNDGFDRWMAKWGIDSVTNPDGCVVAFPAPGTISGTVTVLQLTIQDQINEIAVLRSMLVTRQRQVDELRDQITILNKRVALMEAEERRQDAARAAQQVVGDPDWVQPASLLPRGI